MIKSVSVWFIPKSRDKNNAKIITEAELLELSFVAVPCNPNALSLDQKSLLEEFWLLKEKETLASLSHEKNFDDEDVNDSTTDNTIRKNSEKEILSTLNDIKALLEVLVDGNTKNLSEANILAKETLQNVARTVNQWLSAFKKSL